MLISLRLGFLYVCYHRCCMDFGYRFEMYPFKIQKSLKLKKEHFLHNPKHYYPSFDHKRNIILRSCITQNPINVFRISRLSKVCNFDCNSSLLFLVPLEDDCSMYCL